MKPQQIRIITTDKKYVNQIKETLSNNIEFLSFSNISSAIPYFKIEHIFKLIILKPQKSFKSSIMENIELLKMSNFNLKILLLLFQNEQLLSINKLNIQTIN